MTFHGGYSGKILHVNLSNKQINEEPLEKGFARKFIGGRGFTSRILYDHFTEKLDPLGPENILLFATGPLSGTLWPSSARWTIATKSPLTGILGDANAGGHWGPELKYAGYDLIVVKGKARIPTYLWINDGEIKLENATDLRGRTVSDTSDEIRQRHGDSEIKIVAIGKAGENLVKFACVMSDYHSAAGRCGIGAVMGSKNLKAVAVRGTGGVEIADPEAFLEFAREMREVNLNSSAAESFMKYGTTFITDIVNEVGGLCIKNLQFGQTEDLGDLYSDVIKDKYMVKDTACLSCLQHCGKFYMVKEGSYAGTYSDGPEYETIDALGPRCGIYNFPYIVKANSLLDDYGLDSISTGSAIAFAIECYKKGLITEEDTDGLDLNWEDDGLVLDLIEKTASREGFGAVIAEGVSGMVQKFGKDSLKIAPIVKGLDIIGLDPRSDKIFGLGYAVSTRGADHLRALPQVHMYAAKGTQHKKMVKLFGKKYIEELMDQRSPKHKGDPIVYFENLGAASDALSACKYTTHYPTFTAAHVAKAYSLITGFKINEKQLLEIGARITHVEKAINMKAKLNRKDDSFTDRFTKHPLPDGPAKGSVFEVNTAIDDYYKARNWDLKTGNPNRENFEQMDLKDIADDLENHGYLKPGTGHGGRSR